MPNENEKNMTKIPKNFNIMHRKSDRHYYSEMSQAERKAADYILEHPEEIVDASWPQTRKRSLIIRFRV